MPIITSQAKVNLSALSELSNIKGFKIVHCNICSLLPKIDLIRCELINKPCDIFIVSESWLHAAVPPGLVSIDGYNCIRQDRAVLNKDGKTKSGGGLCIFINSSLVFTEDKALNVNNENLEMVCFTIIPSSSRRIRIFGLYRPPTGDLNAALDTLTGVIDLSRNSGYRLDIILLGDINIDLLSTNSNSKASKQFAQVCGLSQIITTYTRAGSHRKTLIDHIYILMHYILTNGVRLMLGLAII